MAQGISEVDSDVAEADTSSLGVGLVSFGAIVGMEFPSMAAIVGSLGPKETTRSSWGPELVSPWDPIPWLLSL